MNSSKSSIFINTITKMDNISFNFSPKKKKVEGREKKIVCKLFFLSRSYYVIH